MSCRVDTAPLLAGACVVSLYAGHGVRGDAVPSTGTHGPSPVYKDLSLPADAAKEYRWEVVTPPSVGTLQVYEDCSYAYTPPGGTVDLTVSYTYRLWQDGADLGTATQTIVIGSGGTTQVLSDQSVNWVVRTSVQADSAQAWTLRSAVQRDSLQSWLAYQSVVANRDLTWTLRSAVQADSAQAWTLRSAVQADSAQAWSVLSAGQVVSDRTINWTLRSAVQADSAQAWTLRSAVQTDSIQAWLIRQSASANRDLAWAVEAVASVVGDAALAWVTRTTVMLDRQLAWTVSTSAVPPVIRLRVRFTKMPTFITRTRR